MDSSDAKEKEKNPKRKKGEKKEKKKKPTRERTERKKENQWHPSIKTGLQFEMRRVEQQNNNIYPNRSTLRLKNWK